MNSPFRHRHTHPLPKGTSSFSRKTYKSLSQLVNSINTPEAPSQLTLVRWGVGTRSARLARPEPGLSLPFSGCQSRGFPEKPALERNHAAPGLLPGLQPPLIRASQWRGKTVALEAKPRSLTLLPWGRRLPWSSLLLETTCALAPSFQAAAAALSRKGPISFLFCSIVMSMYKTLFIQ